MEANAGKSFQMQIIFNIFPRISLHYKVVPDPVQYPILRIRIWSILVVFYLKTFARNFSNIDFCLKILPLKYDELVMPEREKKLGGHRLRFGENMPGKNA